MTERFIAWARGIGLADQVAIVSDVLPILAAGTPDCYGVALISGTGSSAFGRAPMGPANAVAAGAICWATRAAATPSAEPRCGYALRAWKTARSPSQARRLKCRYANSPWKTVTELTRTVYANTDPRHTIADLATLS